MYIPDKVSAEIKLGHAGKGKMRRGFGAVKVEVELGGSKWRTSIFPTKEGPYLLPVKASIRKKEGLRDGCMLQFTLAPI